MKIISSYLTVAAVALILAAGCRSTKTDKDNTLSQDAGWQRQPLVIDGSDAEWIKPLPYYDKKEKVSYAVTNDKNNLYIMLSARGTDEQEKILAGGLTVWINNQAEKANSEAVGIAYPTGHKPSRESAIMNQARPDLYPEKQHSTEDDLAAYTLYGFSKEETVQNYTTGQTNPEGVQVKIGFNSLGELIYEAMIPLSSIYPQNSSGNFTGKSIAVGLYVEGLLPGEGGRRGGRGGGSGVSFGGGMGMGSFGSGMGMGLSFSPGAFGGRNGRDGDKQLYEQTQLWQVVSLARPGAGH
jgi:hypothetical protein